MLLAEFARRSRRGTKRLREGMVTSGLWRLLAGGDSAGGSLMLAGSPESS